MRLLLLWLTMSGSLWVDVPFVKQEKNGCGSASVWMILQYWKAPSVPAVEEIHREIYSPEAEGVYARDIELYLKSREFQVFTFNGVWDDLARHLSQGRPLIVCLELNSHGVPLHYVVVAGLDDERGLVLVNDPAQRKLLAMDRKQFELAWKGTDNWTLLAIPEKQESPEEVHRTTGQSGDPLLLQSASRAFREQRLDDAKRDLRSDLNRNPSDSYASDFLATVYYLQGNTEAALKYWNRAGKPTLRNIRIDPKLRTNPVLLDRAFAFAPGDIVSLENYRTTQRRLEGAEIFPRHEVELSPADGDDFDAILHAGEDNGPGYISWLRGVPYQTVFPQWSNMHGRTMNLTSLFRWDREKRRGQVALSAPLRQDIGIRYLIGFDGREENWIHKGETFTLRKSELTAEIHSVESGRWAWASGASFSRRSFTNTWASGTVAKYHGTLDYRVLDIPEKRLRLDSTADMQAGRFAGSTPGRFEKVDASLKMQWLPRSRGDDYQTRASLRAGSIFGDAPFDERFAVGMDRDTDLWLHAHNATIDGRKGAALIGNTYVLLNTGFEKFLGETAFFQFYIGPLLDIAHVASNPGWPIDAGIQFRVSVLKSFSISFSLAEDLHTGHPALFAFSQW
jgi:predicted double-glycine peptidase